MRVEPERSSSGTVFDGRVFLAAWTAYSLECRLVSSNGRFDVFGVMDESNPLNLLESLGDERKPSVPPER